MNRAQRRGWARQKGSDEVVTYCVQVRELDGGWWLLGAVHAGDVRHAADWCEAEGEKMLELAHMAGQCAQCGAVREDCYRPVELVGAEVACGPCAGRFGVSMLIEMCADARRSA